MKTNRGDAAVSATHHSTNTPREHVVALTAVVVWYSVYTGYTARLYASLVALRYSRTHTRYRVHCACTLSRDT